VVAGKKIVVAGSGPFLFSVAAGISAHGGNVVGVIEATAKNAWLKKLVTLLQNPSKIIEGVHYLRELDAKKVPIRFKQVVVEAHAGIDGSLESVTVANIDKNFQIKSSYRLSCDVAAVGWGFTPDTSLAGSLRLTLKIHDGSVVVSVDENQRASRICESIEIFAAGESTGIGGSGLALLEGAIAGLSAAHSQKGLKELKSMRKKAQRFANALTQVYKIPTDWKSWLTPETLICRCEEVDYQTLCHAREELGAIDTRGAKLFTRCGMGMCQGRVCAQNISELLASNDADRIKSVYRPIISPVTLGELAQEGLL
jgi:NADPH-dependent 2,4-dienoyl-CoA reductase/sulfur reductase-like enzyme